MSRYYLLFVIVLLFCFQLKILAQIRVQPHGTQITAVICTDGILMAADSRLSFFGSDSVGNNEVVIAYIDGFRKIFPLGRFYIGIAGSSNIGNTIWDRILKRYNKKNKREIKLENEFNNFKSYLVDILKVPDSLLKRNQFLMAGYEDSIPVIFTSDLKDNIKTSKLSGRMFVDTCIKYKFYELGTTNFTCENILMELREAFCECSKKNIIIGGPLHAIKINSNNSFSNITTFPFNSFRTQKDIEKKILTNKLKIYYPRQEYKALLMKLLKNNSKSRNY